MKTIIVTVLLFAGFFTASCEQLIAKEINNPDAICNDFSQAIFYYRNCTHCENLIIFFEGGGGCSSFEDCNNRWDPVDINPLMSSRSYPNRVTGRGLLSSNSEENPLFHNYTHVLVPYCTQDAFLANRTNPKFLSGNSRFHFDDSTPDADNFAYKGRVIFQSIFEDLFDLGVLNASKIVLAGTSAGGVGILNNLAWVQNRLNSVSAQPPELSIIIDSSWFLMFDSYHAVSWNESVPALLDLPSPACHDFSLGFACCTSPACLITKNYLPVTSPPIFAISSIYDIFTLEGALRSAFDMYDNDDDQALLRVFNSYGSFMNQTFIQSYNSHPKLSLFTVSCSQHVYLATSDLWDRRGLLNSTIDASFEEGVFQLTNPIFSDHWNQISVMSDDPSLSITLHEAIQAWYASSFTQAFYTDSNCSGPVCGKCQSQIILQPSRNLWPVVLNVTILVISALMTIVPVSVKFSLYLHMKLILYKQKVYAYRIQQAPAKEKPYFPKSNRPVSIACTELYYRIDTTVGKNQNPAQKVGTDFIDGAETRLNEDQYGVYAALETCMPYCRKPLLNCVTNINHPPQMYDHQQQGQQQQQQQQQQHSDGMDHTDSAGAKYENGVVKPLHYRSDSGISSSIISRTLVHAGSVTSFSTADSLDNLVDEDPQSGGMSRSELREYKKKLRKKTILHHVNMYVNPGELVAIMGPSGSGKTTLLDVILGRRKAGHVEGNIFINGIPLNKMRDWFVVNTGYVRQLATSFYNELTVRENLLFSMNMQARKGESLGDKLKRVEQVIREMGLQEQADVVVGDGIGLGLSGGQRKRLAIAVQLLSMPSIIFLDEPTSGLDSASSLDILKSLQAMAGTGRAIVVTIHQPRSEIFHAFDKILLLCNGQVAFFGSPVKVWEFFRKALISEKELMQTGGQVQDLVLDLLKEKGSQKQVLQAYRESLEPKKVKTAILDSRDLEESDSNLPAAQSRYPGLWYRLLSLESRASLRQNLFTIIYLPIVYTVFGIILGTTYLFTSHAAQIMSVTCLLSCSSSLFMSSIVMSLLVEPLKIFRLEHSDGIASAHELILQVFIRMSAVCTIPLSVCATAVFLLVFQNYNLEVYFVTLLAFLLVNQVWISIFIVLTVLAPSQAHRLCPVFAAIGGFCCGFIVPKPLMPVYYRWIFYINPSFYAYSATTVAVLEDNNLDCDRQSELECFRESGLFVLGQFGLADINPIENLVVLIAMVVLFVMLGVFILYLKANFSVIKESLASYLAPKKHTKVFASVGELNAVDGDHKRRGRRSSSEDSSSAFLDSGLHEVKHTFASVTAPRLASISNEDDPTTAGEDAIDSPSTAGVHSAAVHFAPVAGGGAARSRMLSDGSDDVFFPDELEVINMHEEDEEVRMIHANKKWNERRRQIEAEFQRLRHFSINQRRAGRLRHSMSFGDDLEDKVNNGGEARGGMNPLEPKRRVMSTFLPPTDYTRSASVPLRNHIPDQLMIQPTLETYEEIEEEEDDISIVDDDMMGLPPKDIPHRLSRSAEPIGILDMSEIPLERITVREEDEEKDTLSSCSERGFDEADGV